MKKLHGGTVGKKEEEMFRKGSRVEVTSKDEGLTGTWYTATVLATPSSRKRSKTAAASRQTYLVQYDNLITDDNPSKPLSEYVHVSFIRPEQPNVAGDAAVAGGFEANDVVDVNLRDGWWTGVVKRVVDGGSKYLVHFENPTDEVECNGSEIRIHLDWVDRKWVQPDKQVTIELTDEVDTRKKRARPQESLSKFPKGSEVRTPSPAMPTQSPEVLVNSENVEESQNTPFKKSSPVWKSIESMEVFQKTPQRPHFSPLVNFREDSREGLAVGHMITFANLVEKTLTLQVFHPQSIIESCLETLKELENHGFDVEAIQNRLTELQSLKRRVDQLENDSKEAEVEITKLNEEKKDAEELIDRVKMKMKQVRKKLGVVASLKKAKVKKINALQSIVNIYADNMENTKRDFERIAVSPLRAEMGI